VCVVLFTACCVSVLCVCWFCVLCVSIVFDCCLVLCLFVSVRVYSLCVCVCVLERGSERALPPLESYVRAM